MVGKANNISSFQDLLSEGNKVVLIARMCYKSILISPSGTLSIGSADKRSWKTNPDCHFEVMAPDSSHQKAIKLRSVAYPQFYLANSNGYIIGYVCQPLYNNTLMQQKNFLP